MLFIMSKVVKMGAEMESGTGGAPVPTMRIAIYLGNVGMFLCYKTKKTLELGGVVADAAW
jgi:hypothetical protein